MPSTAGAARSPWTAGTSAPGCSGDDGLNPLLAAVDDDEPAVVLVKLSADDPAGVAVAGHDEERLDEPADLTPELLSGDGRLECAALDEGEEHTDGVYAQLMTSRKIDIDSHIRCG